MLLPKYISYYTKKISAPGTGHQLTSYRAGRRSQAAQVVALRGCISWSLHCCDKNHDQRILGRKSFISAYISRRESITEGSQGWNPNRADTWRQELTQRPRRGTDYWFASPWPSQPAFLRNPEPRLGMAPHTMNWALPHPSLIKKMPYSRSYGAFLQLRLPPLWGLASPVSSWH